MHYTVVEFTDRPRLFSKPVFFDLLDLCEDLREVSKEYERKQ